jgi:hypothetical protein
METVNYYGQELKIDNEVNALKIKQAISYVEEAYEYVSKYLPVNEGSLNSGVALYIIFKLASSHKDTSVADPEMLINANIEVFNRVWKVQIKTGVEEYIGKTARGLNIPRNSEMLVIN